MNMIDWIASKMGLLIFVLAATGILMAFFFMESEIYGSSQKANAASDIARAIESTEDGMEISYSVKISGSYSLKISSDHLDLDGFVRYFISSASPVQINGAEKLKIKKSGNDPIEVSAA